MLSQLNPDLIFDICVYLDAEDIYHLSITSKSLYNQLQSNAIYRLMYISKFGINTNPIGSNWLNKFKTRTSPTCKLYTWGSTDQGRLGYLIRDVDPKHLTRRRHVKVPTNLTNFNPELIIDLKSNGFSFLILTNKGVYYTGGDYKRFHVLTSPGPTTSDYKMPLGLITAPANNVRVGGQGPLPRPHNVLLPGRRHPRIMPMPDHNRHEHTFEPNPDPQPRGATSPNLRLPVDEIPLLREFQNNKPTAEVEEEDSVESGFVTKVKCPGKVRAMASGNQHFIILTSENKIYTWDTGLTSLHGVNVTFPTVPDSKIRKIKSGWSTSGFATDEDLIVWFSRAALSKEDTEQDNRQSEANYFRLHVKNLVDFHLGCDFIIILLSSGAYYYRFNTVHYFHNVAGEVLLSLEDFEPMLEFNEWLIEYNKKGTVHQFSKITGCYLNFAIFVDDQILFGNRERLDNKPEFFELPGGVIELEMGDYHYLALTDKGELYTWGLESGDCGCLGLGDVEKLDEGRNNYRVKTPTKVDGDWVLITANGWHSGGVQA